MGELLLSNLDVISCIAIVAATSLTRQSIAQPPPPPKRNLQVPHQLVQPHQKTRPLHHTTHQTQPHQKTRPLHHTRHQIQPHQKTRPRHHTTHQHHHNNAKPSIHCSCRQP